jgi:hypothetical protein
MSSQSPETPTETISELQLGSLGKNVPFGCVLRRELQGEPLTGREATTPLIIKKVEKVQGGEQAPQNGSLTLPKDVAVKPFSLKGLFNTKLSVLLSLMARGSIGLPGGHADLDGGLLGLQ